MAGEQLDLAAANRHGQQLFIANLFRQPDKTPSPRVPRPAPATLPAALPARLSPYRQLLLFEIDRDLSHRGYRTGGLAERADPAMAAALDGLIRRDAKQYGWSKDLAWCVRTGTRIVLGFQETAEPITASEVAVLAGTGLPMGRVLDVLAEAGLLIDDRTPAINEWLHRQLAELPEPMTGELRRWFAIMLEGARTSPRRRPRAQITARLHLSWALPALRAWTAAGHQSLRQVSRDDVRAVLPASGNPRPTMGQGLRSIFTVLKGQKVLFTNPTSRIKTGFHEPRQPLPVNPQLLRSGLDSPDLARAAIIALVAYHGLRSAALRGLKTTDVRDGRLHIDGRVVLLAKPVRSRITAYLTYRNRSWPSSANPHLFLTSRSANGLTAAGRRWVNLKIDITGSVQALREDRILDEAHASGGDIRRICDMFGLSVSAADRYATTVDHPDLVDKTTPTTGAGDNHP